MTMWFLKFFVSLAAAILLGWVGMLTGFGWIAVAVGAYIGAHIIKIVRAMSSADWGDIWFVAWLSEVFDDLFD
ncbi:hypothetical protein IAQ67_28810 (plasmid) [Paenibacillus peoriae]|uniref:Uncharacterized protein n=1 Tax=Paenibacillus peoriae TaxID=59893 RepID=A0A7H0YH01_9BACL|nr:hypothetical protein [Paenibacillus peoriae]QNR70359.1 hypothetical protein IAQ67_28810 [Paenibacillus peoriae]